MERLRAMSLCPLLLVSILTGVSGDVLSPLSLEQSVSEGFMVSVSYQTSAPTASGDDFFFYRQNPGDAPQFLFYVSGMNISRPAASVQSDTRLSGKVSDNRQCKGEDTVTQTQGDASVPQGHTATIQCTFKTSDPTPTLFWYKQEGRGAPKYMIKKTKSSVTWSKTIKSQEFNEERFEVEAVKDSFSLKIQDVDVTDSAVYYCALQPTRETLSVKLQTKHRRSKANCQCENLSRLQKVHMRITQLCFGHMFPLMAALLLLLLSGVRCEELTALKPEVCAPEGSSVSLGYFYHQEPTISDYFFWYQQYPGKSPDFLISHYGNGISIIENVKGLKFEVKSQNVSLLLSSAAVGDSAVYYCAVKPTVTGNTQTLNKNL
ncbi:uncharacterized protein LOC129457025 [Periophthalmus magnuspinnatus]|uniref:uncharacterized protein LOC129457025 n=1 Tax=Periophthalmus magnuspinnatus TaxID=409849 RepID=UPI0024365682|nr:uncharacterized protein LOC129457025 [Periophthalmus magnuspinnatus]